MQNFLKILVTLSVVGIVCVASLFVLNVVSSAEAIDILQKVVLVLAIVALGGLVASYLTLTK